MTLNTLTHKRNSIHWDSQTSLQHRLVCGSEGLKLFTQERGIGMPRRRGVMSLLLCLPSTRWFLILFKNISGNALNILLYFLLNETKYVWTRKYCVVTLWIKIRQQLIANIKGYTPLQSKECFYCHLQGIPLRCSHPSQRKTHWAVSRWIGPTSQGRTGAMGAVFPYLLLLVTKDYIYEMTFLFFLSLCFNKWIITLKDTIYKAPTRFQEQ